MRKWIVALWIVALLILTASLAFGDTPATVSNAQSVSCSSVNGWNGVATSCYQITLSIAGANDQTSVVGVTSPSGTSLGTVIFITGGGGPCPYDSCLAGGTTVINTLVSAGYTAAQLFFPYSPVGSSTNSGWITGNKGLRAYAARPAAVALWIASTVVTPGTPFGCVGNSGGASTCAYLLGDFGVPFGFVEACSGPTYSDLPNGCNVPTTTSITTGCIGSQTLQYGYNTKLQDVDTSYGTNHACSLAVPAALSHFQNDMILHSGAVVTFPNTYINVVEGTADAGPPLAQASDWVAALTSARSISTTCCPGCTHDITATSTGQNQIIADVENFFSLLNAPKRKK